MKHSDRPASLRVVGGQRRTATADEVLREGARIFAEYLTRRLPDLDQDDPSRDRVLSAADQLRSLAG